MNGFIMPNNNRWWFSYRTTIDDVEEKLVTTFLNLNKTIQNF